MITTFRNYRDERDLEAQYTLWLRATESLPFAWKSTEANVRHISQHVSRFPGARLFAERGGKIVGYIGTHDPFQWKNLGSAVPFGFPWTVPEDPSVERALYDRMLAATPGVYAGERIDFYIQRFRASWARHHAFLRERGWREAWRDPILSKPCLPGPTRASRALTPVDTDALVELAAKDPCLPEPKPTAAAIAQRFRDGWQEMDSAFIVAGAGAFAFEVRKPWAEVKLFYADPARTAEVIGAMEARAAERDARGVYFTIRPGAERRRPQIEAQGYTHADDDAFVRLDAV
jgi:hypothetical protein